MPMSEEYVEKLKLPQMVTKIQITMKQPLPYPLTVQTLPQEFRSGTSDHSYAGVAEDAKPEDFRRPGHMFPLLQRKNGVLGAQWSGYRGNGRSLSSGRSEGMACFVPRDHERRWNYDAHPQQLNELAKNGILNLLR